MWFQYDETKKRVMVIVKSDKNFCLFEQKPHIRIKESLKQFNVQVEEIESFGVTIGNHPKMVVDILE